MQVNTQKGSPIGVGVLTILTILLVLTLAMFSALTYASARADLALSKKNAQTISKYYLADAKAEQMAQEFAQGEDASLDTAIPVTDTQSLSLRLERISGPHYKVLAWNMTTQEQVFDADSQPLQVWTGP